MLAYYPKLKGLSKNRIILVSLFITFGAVVYLIWGSFGSHESQNSKSNTESLYFNNSNSLNSANSIIEKALESVLKNSSSNIGHRLVNASEVKPDNIDIVPPIELNDRTNQALLNLKHKLVTSSPIVSNHEIYSAKTVVFNANYPDNSVVPSIINRQDKMFNIDESSAKKNNSSGVPFLNKELSQSIANESSAQFSDNKATTNDYLNSEIQSPRSAYELKAGTVIPATMVNGINSDLAGQVIAVVRQNVYDSISRRYLLIPQGAKLIGLYDSKIAYGQTRILVAWNRLIYQDGSSINLKAMPGTDLEGYSGFYDDVDNKYWQIFGTSFIMGVITGAMQYSQNNTNANVQSGGIGLTTDNNPTVGQTLYGSLGQQLGQTGLSITQKNLNVAPTLIVKPNYPFNIMLTADVTLKAYQK